MEKNMRYKVSIYIIDISFHIYIYTHTYISESLCCKQKLTQCCKLTILQLKKKHVPGNESVLGDTQPNCKVWNDSEDPFLLTVEVPVNLGLVPRRPCLSMWYLSGTGPGTKLSMKRFLSLERF